MRVRAAITVASALFAVGGGCSRPWQASTADLAPLNSPPYVQTRYSNSLDPPPPYSDVDGLWDRTHRALCRNRNRRQRGREHARSRRSPFRPPPHTNSSRDLPHQGKSRPPRLAYLFLRNAIRSPLQCSVRASCVLLALPGLLVC